MVTNLPDGVVVVTGAASGISAATAEEFVNEGWNELLLIDLDADRLEAAAEPLRTAGASVDTLASDVTDTEFPGRLVTALRGRGIASLFHGAGVSPIFGDAKRILAINLDATAVLVDTVLDLMVEGSAVVLVASNSSYFPMPPEAAEAFRAPLPPEGTAALAHLAPQPQLAYPLSKLGVRTLVKNNAKRFGERGVRIVSLSPGAVETPMTKDEVPNSEAAQRMIAASGIGRIGQPEELAAVAVFLASPRASFVTAVDVLVDGGQTAAMGF